MQLWCVKVYYLQCFICKCSGFVYHIWWLTTLYLNILQTGYLQLYIWCFMINYKSDVSWSILYLVFHDQFYIWCFMINFISDVSWSILYLMFHDQFYIWCFMINFISDVSWSILYRMFHDQFYIWCFVINFITDVSWSTLYVMFHGRFTGLNKKSRWTWKCFLLKEEIPGRNKISWQVCFKGK